MDRGAWLATVHGITKIRAVSTEHSPLQMLSLGLFLSFFLTVFFKKSVYIETDYYLPALWQKFYLWVDIERKQWLVGLRVGQWESSVQLTTELIRRSQGLNVSLVF